MSDLLQPVQFGQPGVMTWDDVQERYPSYDVRPIGEHANRWGEYSGPNEDHGWAVSELAHGQGGSSFEWSDVESEHDLPYTVESVHPSQVRFEHHPVTDSRVQSAMRGYRQHADVPPPLLVARAGEYHVADGHHRLAAANALNLHLPSIVAHSPRTDRLEY